MNLFFEARFEADYTLCTAKGEIDLYNAREVKDKVGDVMDSPESSPHLVLDLRGVKYIDSTGLGILIGIKRRIAENNGKLALVITENRIVQLFSITGLMNIFTIVGTLEEAAAKLKE